MFDWKKPSAMLLGRYQPFHEGHLALFKEALSRVGQVVIAVRETHGTSEKDPFPFEFVEQKIREALKGYEGFYEVVRMPNVTNVFYGRDVGYSVERISLPEEVESISATKVRASMFGQQ